MSRLAPLRWYLRFGDPRKVEGGVSVVHDPEAYAYAEEPALRAFEPGDTPPRLRSEAGISAYDVLARDGERIVFHVPVGLWTFSGQMENFLEKRIMADDVWLFRGRAKAAWGTDGEPLVDASTVRDVQHVGTKHLWVTERGDHTTPSASWRRMLDLFDARELERLHDGGYNEFFRKKPKDVSRKEITDYSGALRLRFTTPQQQRALDEVETLWLRQWDEDHRATARANPRRASSLSTLARSFTSKMANAPTDALRAWGAQKGLEYLGEGESRAVFALPDGKTVVKFVFSYYGSDANLDEARAWREASPRVRRLLVPVLDADPEGRWLVMERVTPADVNARTPHAAVDALLACGFADINNRNLSADGRLLDYGKHLWSMWRGDCVALPNPRHNPRETVADRIKRFERYEVRTEESKDYPLFGRGFLALAAQRYSEDEYVRLVAAALELDGRWGLLAEPSAYPAPKGVLLKALKERYAAERTKPITVEVRFRDMWEATAYVGEGRYDRTEVGFVAAAPDYPLACPEEYATLRKAHGDAPTYEVVSSRVHPLMRRRGLGVRLYRALGETLGKERGAYLFANACGSRGDTSAEAQRVYRSLRRDFPAEGLVVYFPPTKANPRRRNPEPTVEVYRDRQGEVSSVKVRLAGGEVSAVRPDPAEREMYVGWSGLPETERGKGLGIRMYAALMDWAMENDFILTSDETVSREAGRVWEALARRGYPIRKHPEARTITEGNIGAWYAHGRKPPFLLHRRNPRNPQTDSAAFRRWFGGSKVVGARGEPLVVYHGTAADDFSAFSAGPRSHLGFHFGTAASAEAKLTGDVRRWEPGQARRGGAPTYLTTEDMRVRARDVNRAALATIRAERSRIESGIRERSVPIDLGALLDAHGGDVEAALAEFHLLREERDAKPTPEERRRLDDLDAAERRADDELANLFAFRRPGERVLPVYLSIENPLRMRDTNWGEPAMIKKDHPELRLRGRTLTEIRSEIEGRGYDGIVYENAVEDVGSLSWIAFRPEQIKSATGNRGTFDPADLDIRHNPRRNGRGGYTSAMRTDPELWEEVKAEVTRGSKGGLPGQWSARKAQLAVALYKARGGDYYGPKSPYNALAKWTREKWRTKSGRPSLETGERYLPSAAIAALTPAEYAATTRAKRAGMKKGQQFVPQPEAVAKKVRRYRRNPQTDTPAFRRWFGDSKVVDARGEPLVVYHAGFDVLRSPEGAFRLSEYGRAGMGVYFTPSLSGAEAYLDRARGLSGYAGLPTPPPVLTEVYLSVQNPAVVDRRTGLEPSETLANMVMSRRVRLQNYDLAKLLWHTRKAGYDGVFVVDGNGIDEIVVFDPRNIKSATANVGTYDPNDPDIRRNPRVRRA